MENNSTSRKKIILSGLIPFAFVILMVSFIFGPGSAMLELGIPLPEISIEKVIFIDSEIQAVVRNTGPIPVTIVMADVNDRIQPAAVEPDGTLQRFETATVRIPYEWNVSEPYSLGITLDDGLRFEKIIESATYEISFTTDNALLFAVIGIYVGVIPVMIGLLWYPFIKKIKKQSFHFFLALTAGLLLFLGIDAIDEAIEISNENLSQIFNGNLLIFTVIALSFLGLYYAGDKLAKNSTKTNLSRNVAIALMISIGIGLHNFGEGLAIGASVGLGSIAFTSFLIVGFALHNTTEGIAIASLMSRGKMMIGMLFCLGLIAGVPAIFGTWIGGFQYSPFSIIIFLAIGAGAIFQVLVVLLKWIYDENQKTLSNASVISGFVVGILIMYITSIVI
ncbi:MAG: ZIP family metal transporter [Nitrosopumilus sp.]